MHVHLIYAHPEPQSFTNALLQTARIVLADAGHSHDVSDLYGEAFDPVLSRRDFSSIANADYFSVQPEQMRAEESRTFSADIEREQARVAIKA